jgi:predicted enzyme related to lactoylglutathione lyase
MDPVQHFEIPYKSRDRAKKFYFDAFGWQVFDLPGSGYSLLTSVETHANGMPKRAGAINGGLTPRDDHVQGPTLLIKVGNVDAHLERIREHGGEVLTEPVHMGPVRFSRVKDTEGNVIAVFEDAPEPTAQENRQANRAKGGQAPAATGAAARKPKAAKSGLTPKQRAQRKYAAQMRTVRARAKTAKGGKGRIADRSGATKLRRQLGLKKGKAAKKKR